MDGNSRVLDVSLVPTSMKETIERTKFVGPNVVITQVMESSSESVIISATVSISCIILIVVIYCFHHLYPCKRTTVDVPTENLNSLEYFTRPRRPVLFLDEVAGTSSNAEYPVYWQRPLHPISIDKDMYCVVTRY